MSDPDEFDAFYKDARARLLLQTWALTGDLPASRSAVRDAFVMAWHHWRKVSRLPDPEAYVRPQAWRHAQRRHTARIWHRDRSLGPEARATLEALGKLPLGQRKALLLTQLSTAGLGEIAREIGVPRHEAERLLQRATAQFAVKRDVATTAIRPLFEPLRRQVEETPWPRATIVRRAGAGRRRTHTLVGALAAVAAVLVSGTLVTDVGGVRPTLAREQSRAAAPAPSSDPTPAGAGREAEEPEEVEEESEEEFSADALLRSPDVAARVGGRGWRDTKTSDNTAGDGLVFPCQQERFADPKGLGALVRRFESQPAKGTAEVSFGQSAELSRSERAARKTYEETLRWYAGCADQRVQLLRTSAVAGAGDAATVVVLRSWAPPVTTYVAGVARSGSLTTTTMTTLPGATSADLAESARLLGVAVNRLCGQPDAGRCAPRPRLRFTKPVPVGQVPGMLSEVDLPPVAGVTRPWVGTEPRKATVNVAATRCDRASFNQASMRNNLTRSFVIPGSRLLDQFGLTESVATMPEPQAKAFVADIRDRMRECPDRDLGTKVRLVSTGQLPRLEFAVWSVRTELDDSRAVTYLMGIVRDGPAVGQVGFVPSGQVTMTPDTFRLLVLRARDRISVMAAR